MAMRQLTLIEKNNLISYSGFIGAVEQAYRAKAEFFLNILLDVAVLPGYIADRKTLAALRQVALQIRTGGYTALEIAKQFLVQHNCNIDDTNTAVDQLTIYIGSHDTAGNAMITPNTQLDYFCEIVFRNAAINIGV
jgi:hypothetical protein